MQVSVNLDQVSKFAYFDSDTNTIVFDLLDTGTKPGYYTASIILNDGTDLTSYNLIIKVNEADTIGQLRQVPTGKHSPVVH